MNRPTPQIFVSYSRADEAFKNEFLRHLYLLKRQGLIAAWTDRDIVAGEAWESAIFDRLEAAGIVILLVSADFLASDFCYEREMLRAIERHERGESVVIPVIVRPCDWANAPFAKLQGLPKDAKPISTWREYDEAWLDVVQGIRRVISGSLKPTAPRRSMRVSTSGLPASRASALVGREAELKLLDDAWEDPDIRAITFVAIGGAGKTALVDHWLQRLERDGWRGAEAVFVWSFYSQGAGDDRQSTGDAFVNSALRFFGEPDSNKAGTAQGRGLLLAELIRARKTLLVLDGLEPIQEPPNSSKAGRIKDLAVAALVRHLASTQPGLLVITTREPVADLMNRAATSAPLHNLERLSDAAGADLLRRLGVEGRDHELEYVVGELQGHCLGLTLLGTYLRDAEQGDIRTWRDAALLDAAEILGDEKVFRVMARYADWFGGPERQILSILGLFDRPAESRALTALREEPGIPGLTDQIVGLPSASWNRAISILRQARLLFEASSHDSDTIDAHPLVREYFGRLLEQEDGEAFRAGHDRLYLHYAEAAPDLPDTLEEMQPLYRAIRHGCRARRRQETLDEIFHRRVHRGNEFFSLKRLGAFGSELAALGSFFERKWDRPAEDLREGDRAFLLKQASLCLRSLGRVGEAVQPMEASGAFCIERGDWKGAAISFSNLSALTLTLGHLDDATSHGASSVELADRSGDAYCRLAFRAALGDALHTAGRLDEAESAFREAETLQSEKQPQFPKLYSLSGYQFCSLLLTKAAPFDGSALTVKSVQDAETDLRNARRRCEEVRERASQALEWSTQLGGSLISIALDHLSIGRAELGLALAHGADFAVAVVSLDRAVQGLRKAGDESSVPHGLIARATLYRYRGDVSAAVADLMESLEIAERGSMRLHECDTHLEWARLCLSLGDLEGARSHVERAAVLIETTGYFRRNRELQELGEAVGADELQEMTPESDNAPGFHRDPLRLVYFMVLERRLPADALLNLRASEVDEASRALLEERRKTSSIETMDSLFDWLDERHRGARPNELWYRWCETSRAAAVRRLRERFGG